MWYAPVLGELLSAESWKCGGVHVSSHGPVARVADQWRQAVDHQQR